MTDKCTNNFLIKFHASNTTSNYSNSLNHVCKVHAKSNCSRSIFPLSSHITIKSSTLSEPKWNTLLLLFHIYKQNENTRNKLTNELWIGWQRIVCRMSKCMLQSLQKLCHIERPACSFQASKHTYFFFQFTFNIYIYIYIFITSTLKSLAIHAIWLALSSVIYS